MIGPQVFIDYEAQRGYNLWTVKAYGQMLERTGFKQVAAIDKTNLMVNIMRMELKKFYEIKADFVKKFSMKDFTDIEEVENVKYNRRVLLELQTINCDVNILLIFRAGRRS